MGVALCSCIYGSFRFLPTNLLICELLDLQKVLMPQSVKYFKNTLKVRNVKTPIRLARYIPVCVLALTELNELLTIVDCVPRL